MSVTLIRASNKELKRKNAERTILFEDITLITFPDGSVSIRQSGNVIFVSPTQAQMLAFMVEKESRNAENSVSKYKGRVPKRKG